MFWTRAVRAPRDAYIKGNLDILLNLLEGRIDGDALFFTRGLVITGDTAAIVGLRNTLDREEIDFSRTSPACSGRSRSPWDAR